MIYTFNTKAEQLQNGFFRTGSGPLKILIVGSCRAMPYLNYLARATGNDLTIFYINPSDWHWDASGKLVVMEEVVDAMEFDERILSVIRSANVFIHEHFGNYGMFNTSREADKNIYLFGMNAERDISVPNFHDHFILRNDFAAFGPVPEDWIERGNAAVDKFCDLCSLSSFPEMAEHFRSNWKTTRFFWTANHISAEFSIYIFRRMNEKFLHIPLDPGFWKAASAEDMFQEPHTHATQEDAEAYGITWMN